MADNVTSSPVGCGAWQDLEERLPAECFCRQDRDMATDLKYIIAEVLAFHPNTEIRIGGMIYPAKVVQAAYKRLQVEHLELVIHNFRQQTCEIKRPKAYLRTALYNAVFELNARYTNMAIADSGGCT